MPNTLPTHDLAARPAATDEVPSPGARKKVVLLIDDDSNVLSVFSMALEQYGFEVLTASSGRSGITMAKTHRPDVVFSDMNMPGDDGQEVVMQLRKDPDLGSTPIILMTGDSYLAESATAAKFNANELLIKPISLDALVKCVKSFV